jgi:dTDP-4-dehydrorhamnose 3,5-epimerase
VKVRELAVPGALEITPVQHRDERGVFLEWFKAPVLQEAVGHGFRLAQANISVSHRGTLRGVHFADVPPGQAKYVTCPSGRVLDVVVDTRVGSPTFGQSDAVVLDSIDRRAVYVAEGLGHAFLALTDDTVISYLCTAGYNASGEHSVQALDPALGISWPEEIEPVFSPRDADAPTLEEARVAGLLPRYEDCLAYDRELRGPTA